MRPRANGHDAARRGGKSGYFPLVRRYERAQFCKTLKLRGAVSKHPPARRTLPRAAPTGDCLRRTHGMPRGRTARANPARAPLAVVLQVDTPVLPKTLARRAPKPTSRGVLPGARRYAVEICRAAPRAKRHDAALTGALCSGSHGRKRGARKGGGGPLLNPDRPLFQGVRVGALSRVLRPRATACAAHTACSEDAQRACAPRVPHMPSLCTFR